MNFFLRGKNWIPAFAGMTMVCGLAVSGCAEMLRWNPPPERSTNRSSSAEKISPAPAQPPATQLLPASYQVVKGDTLFSIAFRHSLDFRELARWNAIGADYRIVPGQRILLTPQPDTTVSAVIAPPDAPIPKPAEPPLKSAASDPASLPVPIASGYTWQWPTQGSVLRSYAPAQGFKGLDFTGNLGQPVFAAAPGRVVYSGNALKGYGELIIIKHDEVRLSAYGYNRKRHVVEGDTVTGGQPIGELGLGPENKPLLHFEIRERGKPVNPKNYLPARPSTGG